MSSAHVRHLLVRENDRLGIVSLRDVVKGSLSDDSPPPRASSAEMRRMFGKSFGGSPDTTRS